MINELGARTGSPDLGAACLMAPRPIDAPSKLLAGSFALKRAFCRLPRRPSRMATAAPTQSLPLFYRGIEPLNVSQHGKMHVRTVVDMGQIGRTHAIPITFDEFTLVQCHYPIAFSIRDSPIPIALID